MAANRKYYVVWEGHAPGIYESWDECRAQTEGYPGATFKAYNDLTEATEAYRGDPREQLAFARALKNQMKAGATCADYSAFPEIRLDAVAVDGACAGNPGAMEYRCVRVADGVEIFHVGPLQGGTNNIAEYLALIHAAAMLEKRGQTDVPIYSDSRTAQAWIRRGHSNSTLQPDGLNTPVLAMLERADKWLGSNTIKNPILKWDTERWGEIPADFGRK